MYVRDVYQIISVLIFFISCLISMVRRFVTAHEALSCIFVSLA